MPNGQKDWVVMGEQEWFDVYVWGSGAGTVLYGPNFDIGAPSGHWHDKANRMTTAGSNTSSTTMPAT